jgi:hypothetical protein
VAPSSYCTKHRTKLENNATTRKWRHHVTQRKSTQNQVQESIANYAKVKFIPRKKNECGDESTQKLRMWNLFHAKVKTSRNVENTTNTVVLASLFFPSKKQNLPTPP